MEISSYYLSIVVNYNGNSNTKQKRLTSRNRKAMFSLKSKVNQMYLNSGTMFTLFYSYIGSILHYGCEVWSNHNDNDIEKVHLFIGRQKAVGYMI